MNSLLQATKKSCCHNLETAIKKIFQQQLPISDSLLETPPDEKLGDFAFPCFALAKELKKSPVDIARALADTMTKLPPEIASVHATGPYVNFFVNPAVLAKKLLQEKKSQTKKRGAKIVIEYVSPNTNKPLHIGHARNAFLGDAVARMYEYLGNTVVRTCLVNDRGIHICKSMVAYQEDGASATPTNTKKKGDHLVGDYYVLYNTILQKDPSIEERAKECLQKWETGDARTRALWKKMNTWVLKGLNETYKRFGIAFDKTYLESDLYTHGKDIILKGFDTGAFKQDETGAVYADLEQFNLPNKILLRKDGTAIYITQDIYLAFQKWKEHKPSASLYVVASEQDMYFKQFFAVLKLLGVPYADHLIHLSYGMVRLPGGKIKSREGTTADADALLDELESMVTKEIVKREKDLNGAEVKKRARAIALSAFKYFLLVVGPKSDMIFNPKESIAIHGKTGPYILYTYARLKSILRKSHAVTATFDNSYDFAAEKPLLKQILFFPHAIQEATTTTNPSLLANYLYSLAQSTNDYYHTTSVLKAGDTERASRLLLIAKIADTLKEGLALLGIHTIEKM
ncbi:MAG: arginine--tRNA ligase [Candidatus Uhrbacteria bacterium]|nr:arginine--tRNA ligase [Candidatus Uhrbacteria bacterium]